MKRTLWFVTWTLCIAFVSVSPGCGGGDEGTPTTVTAEQIHQAILAANSNGVVAGLAFSNTVLPSCIADTSVGGTYSLIRVGSTGLPDWLSFDSATRTLSLSSGYTTVPDTVTAATQLTYSCTGVGSDQSVTFTLNDSDEGGVIDGDEYTFGEVPLVGNPPGWIWLNASNVNLYRNATTAPFKVPTGITKTSVGMNPADAADDTADFDGDSINNKDEIAAGTNIFVAASNARFVEATGSPIAVGTTPSYVASADFDGDGNLDLAVTNFTSETLQVFLGNGNGTFIEATGSPNPLLTGSAPGGLTVGDYNADGNTDIAIAGSGDDIVFLYFGRGNGQFSFDTNSPYLGPSIAPRGIASGDYDNDGDLDIATANYSSDNYAILVNNGSATFVVSQSVDTVGDEPDFLTFGDFNASGSLDLAIADHNTAVLLYSLAVVLGNGDGTFNLSATYRCGLRSWGVTTADIDSDGDLDLLLTNYLTNDISVLVGSGTGTFAESALVTTYSQPSQIVAADFDGDGDIDMAIANVENGVGTEDLSVYLNQGGGTFSEATGSPYRTGNNAQGIAVGDFNNDGILDLAVTNIADSNMTILLGV